SILLPLGRELNNPVALGKLLILLKYDGTATVLLDGMQASVILISRGFSVPICQFHDVARTSLLGEDCQDVLDSVLEVFVTAI
ncbi:MAG: hypothetical protein AAGF71_05085, partial [Pseudomonadota bacterium]